MKRTPFFVVVSLFTLTGCALPVPVQIALWAADGLSLVDSGKTLGDHGLSLAMQEDCAVWRLVPEGRICTDADPDTAVAEADPAPAPEPEPEPKPKPGRAEEPVPTAAEVAFVTASGPAGPDPFVFDDSFPLHPDDFASAGTAIPSTPTLVVARDVNLRRRPAAGSPVIRPLLRHETAVLLDDRNGWLKVRPRPDAPDAAVGWVDGRYLRRSG